ncbi:MAG: dienelactone hydrolase family protein, partial [candidate division KSB1 bacterium]|nr:dienelactone hydrolase family protein [candidate division KSB1 bacterium]
EIVAQIPKIRQAIFKTIPALMNIVDYLYTRPDVDRSKLYIIGASLGAPFAVDVAALDNRIKAVILLYGGGDISKLIANLLQQQIKSALLRKSLGQVIEWIIAPTEPLKYVHRISPRPLLLINGRNDESVPMECAEALYEKAQQPKELVWLETQHARPRKTELTRQLEIMMKTWLMENKLL